MKPGASIVGVWGLFAVLFVPATVCGGGAPPFTDYCRMLGRDIAGKQHGFLAGNHLYYVGGACDAKWRVR